ncbi:hypothetical protein J4416_01100 [Candidatus Pacearchaeota archaeon]|nr:hypothetical protein [Candidatus Pacearchaeota archaeon]HLC73140.1 hypothetical protein [Candidatus Nanoarchaeia archaeon]
MLRRVIILLFVLGNVFLVSSLTQLSPPEIIVFNFGQTTSSISFYNTGSDSIFTARLEKGLVSLLSPSVWVDEKSYGSFSLLISGDISPGVYFDTLTIYRDEIPIVKTPVIIGVESINRLRKYDSLIKLNPNDISFIEGDLIISPEINIFKLDFDPPLSNLVSLKVFIYSLDGALLDSSAEVVSVSQQASLKRFYNLGAIEQEDLLVVAMVENDASTGLDVERVAINGAWGYSLSPPTNYSFYSLLIYFSIIFLLLAFFILAFVSLLRHIRLRKRGLR